jgi:hypothetical protein
VITVHNTYTNTGGPVLYSLTSVNKSKVSFPLISFLSSKDLMESGRAWYFMTSVFITRGVVFTDGNNEEWGGSVLDKVPR